MRSCGHVKCRLIQRVNCFKHLKLEFYIYCCNQLILYTCGRGSVVNRRPHAGFSVCFFFGFRRQKPVLFCLFSVAFWHPKPQTASFFSDPFFISLSPTLITPTYICEWKPHYVHTPTAHSQPTAHSSSSSSSTTSHTVHSALRHCER